MEWDAPSELHNGGMSSIIAYIFAFRLNTRATKYDPPYHIIHPHIMVNVCSLVMFGKEIK